MIRGEPAIGRDQSREPRLYSVEPVWGADHEAVIRFYGQGSEAAGPFSQRHCSHSRMRIAATSDRHRLIEDFSHFVTSMTAPIASGWTDCRVGLAPTGKRRLCTAHTHSEHC